MRRCSATARETGSASASGPEPRRQFHRAPAGENPAQPGGVPVRWRRAAAARSRAAASRASARRRISNRRRGRRRPTHTSASSWPGDLLLPVTDPAPAGSACSRIRANSKAQRGRGCVAADGQLGAQSAPSRPGLGPAPRRWPGPARTAPRAGRHAPGPCHVRFPPGRPRRSRAEGPGQARTPRRAPSGRPGTGRSRRAPSWRTTVRPGRRGRRVQPDPHTSASLTARGAVPRRAEMLEQVALQPCRLMRGIAGHRSLPGRSGPPSRQVGPVAEVSPVGQHPGGAG